MEEGGVPEQQAMDDIRCEARLEVLGAIRDLEEVVRADEVMGGLDAIKIGVLSQQIIEKTRVYRMAVNVGDQPGLRAKLADTETGAVEPR